MPVVTDLHQAMNESIQVLDDISMKVLHGLAGELAEGLLIGGDEVVIIGLKMPQEFARLLVIKGRLEPI